MYQQISNTCRIAHFHLRNIGAVRKYVTREACEKLVHAFITSRLDYGNSLLYGTPDYHLARLQRIFNTAARILTLTPLSVDIIYVLHSLHWLPVKQRINYKILLLTFRALNGMAPAYLSDLLHFYSPAKNLRSAEKQLLVVPPTFMKTAGDRAFSSAAPILWNSLPFNMKEMCSLDSFKTSLKTSF